MDCEVSPEAWEGFVAKRNGALLGCDIVTKYQEQYSWRENEEFAIADFDGLTLFMAGVFTPRDPSYRNVILADREYLQDVAEERGVAHQLFVKIEDRDFASAAIAEIAALDFPVEIQVEPAQVALDRAVDDLNDMLRYAGFVVAFTVLVILLCIANTISMSTYDRAQEIGILRSLGFERSRVLRIVLGESTVLSLLGGFLGCGAAYTILTLSQQQLIMRGYTIPLVIRSEVLAVAIASSVIVGLTGGFIPAFKASRIDIVKSLRNVE